AELLSAELAEREIPDGGIFALELCWRPLATTDRPLTVLVHLIGPENALIADRRTYPGLGKYPTTNWQPGVPFCDTVRVRIRQRPPRTLVYRVEVSLLDAQAGRRLTAFDSQAEPLGAAFVGSLRLAVDQPPPAAGPAANGDAIQLLAAELNPIWPPGVEQRLELTWRANADLSQDYQVYVHLRRPGGGAIVAQADGPPLGGWYPTSWWPVGETISEQRAFPLPAGTPPGQYELVAGFYDLATGERLGEGHFLGAVEVPS
ncbi:MAG: hypothetical protein ACRDHL_03435, partial [Candidatus Promineifilaceae bacterium]